MAKLNCRMVGNFDVILAELCQAVESSLSATLQGESNYDAGDVRCAVRVYERYSIAEANRVSLSLNLFEHEEIIYLTAITAGGRHGILPKLNTIGEHRFLDVVENVADHYAI